MDMTEYIIHEVRHCWSSRDEGLSMARNDAYLFIQAMIIHTKLKLVITSYGFSLVSSSSFFFGQSNFKHF
jgi:hypothetical protein